MFKDFFRGRYGFDILSFFLAVIAVIFLKFRYLWVISVLTIGYAGYRALSKNISGRTLELQKFTSFLAYIRQGSFSVLMKIRNAVQPVNRQLTSYRTRFKQRKDFVFLNCPKCKKTLRLPRNKGKLLVTCPLCGFQFHKKT